MGIDAQPYLVVERKQLLPEVIQDDLSRRFSKGRTSVLKLIELQYNLIRKSRPPPTR